MTRSTHRWLLITAASVLAIGMSACQKTPAASDAGTASATAPDATNAAAVATDTTNAMSSDASAANNDAGSTAPSQ